MIFTYFWKKSLMLTKAFIKNTVKTDFFLKYYYN